MLVHHNHGFMSLTYSERAFTGHGIPRALATAGPDGIGHDWLFTIEDSNGKTNDMLQSALIQNEGELPDLIGEFWDRTVAPIQPRPGDIAKRPSDAQEDGLTPATLPSEDAYEERTPGHSFSDVPDSPQLSDRWRRIIRMQGSSGGCASPGRPVFPNKPSNQTDTDEEDFLGLDWRRKARSSRQDDPEDEVDGIPSASAGSGRRRARSPTVGDTEDDPPSAKRARADRRARTQQLRELYGLRALVAAENLAPEEGGRPSPRPIPVKDRLGMRTSQLESISPNSSMRRSTSGQSPNNVTRRRITRLVHTTRGVVENRYTNGNLVKESPADSIGGRRRVTETGVPGATEDDVDWAGLFTESRAIGLVDEASHGEEGLPLPPTLLEDDDLPDYEDVIEPDEGTGDAEELLLISRETSVDGPALGRLLSAVAEPRRWQQPTIRHDADDDGPTLFSVPNAVPPFIERDRFRLDFILPRNIVGSCLDLSPEAERHFKVPALRIQFKDFAVPFLERPQLNDVLKGMQTIAVDKLQDSRNVVRNRSLSNQWTAGVGMCAIIDVIDDIYHERSRLLLQEATRRMADDNRYIFHPTRLPGVYLVIFPSEDVSLCEILLIPRNLRNLDGTLLIARLELPEALQM